jgi:uncharacterized protein YegP (UPF0339 family)
MDEITYIKDARGDWRWQRIDLGNHKEVGASSEGYENKAEMKENARRLNGPPSQSLIYPEDVD